MTKKKFIGHWNYYLPALTVSTLIAPEIWTPNLDYTARRSRFTVGILLVHGSALVEVTAAALITLLTAQPLGRLTLHSCGVTRYYTFTEGLQCPLYSFRIRCLGSPRIRNVMVQCFGSGSAWIFGPIWSGSGFIRAKTSHWNVLKCWMFSFEGW
jgi:hypothetical protein